MNYAYSYRGARLRLALAIMAVTGIRISELLSLKMEQVKTLFVGHWIAINRAKRGPSSHKAFLTKKGTSIMRQRLRDFEILSYIKEDDAYIFTAENSNKPLERETFTQIINNFLKDCALKIDGQPKLLSHSFRIGFITQLWRDTNDIEFVRQVIGHAKFIIRRKLVKKGETPTNAENKFPERFNYLLKISNRLITQVNIGFLIPSTFFNLGPIFNL